MTEAAVTAIDRCPLPLVWDVVAGLAFTDSALLVLRWRLLSMGLVPLSPSGEFLVSSCSSSPSDSVESTDTVLSYRSIFVWHERELKRRVSEGAK